MSRQIDLTKPLSDADRQYLLERSDNVSLERNAANVAGLNFSAGTALTGDPEKGEEKPLEELTGEELHDKLKALGLPVSGTNDEKLARLYEATLQEPPAS
jgi:hypothetical protein